MGECIISRAAGEGDAIIPITPGYHTTIITLRDPSGKIIPNYPLLCNDSNKLYNYTTNEKGQVMFVVNSGYLNIYYNNFYNEIYHIDIKSGWYNIQAPIGVTSRLNMNLLESSNSVIFNKNSKFQFYTDRICNIQIVGGGGSGGGGSNFKDVYIGTRDWAGQSGGGGGGAGYMNTYNNQPFKSDNIYNFIIGIGGGSVGMNTNGITGGTSYIENTEYSAAGGQGGNRGSTWDDIRANGGQGGLGNGGKTGINGENSSVDFAGGGGGGGSTTDIAYLGWGCGIGGNPGGGKGFNSNSGAVATSGRNGGGGGGGFYQNNSGNGGNGIIKIIFA